MIIMIIIIIIIIMMKATVATVATVTAVAVVTVITLISDQKAKKQNLSVSYHRIQLQRSSKDQKQSKHLSILSRKVMEVVVT